MKHDCIVRIATLRCTMLPAPGCVSIATLVMLERDDPLVFSSVRADVHILMTGAKR